MVREMVWQAGRCGWTEQRTNSTRCMANRYGVQPPVVSSVLEGEPGYFVGTEYNAIALPVQQPHPSDCCTRVAGDL